MQHVLIVQIQKRPWWRWASIKEATTLLSRVRWWQNKGWGKAFCWGPCPVFPSLIWINTMINMGYLILIKYFNHNCLISKIAVWLILLIYIHSCIMRSSQIWNIRQHNKNRKKYDYPQKLTKCHISATCRIYTIWQVITCPTLSTTNCENYTDTSHKLWHLLCDVANLQCKLVSWRQAQALNNTYRMRANKLIFQTTRLTSVVNMSLLEHNSTTIANHL